LYDFFIEDMRGYLAIEFIDGVTLRQLVAQSGPRPDGEVVKLGAALCDALSYLHDLCPPIIHGDVTPDNVMLHKNGEIRLMDFDASQELTRNKTNTVVGKHSYMSPEQFKGMLSETSDIYALGCTLHFLLTGADPEPISESRPMEVRSSVSAAMNQVVATATKFEESGRFATLKELRTQLERV
jgi:serine/threonine-protein kinase